jgi:hypothetical protein
MFNNPVYSVSQWCSTDINFLMIVSSQQHKNHQNRRFSKPSYMMLYCYSFQHLHHLQTNFLSV